MEHRRIIKLGTIVFATHEDGSMDPDGPFSMGLFDADTRFLSRFQIYLNGIEPRLLGSTEESPFQAGFLHTNTELSNVPARSIGVLQRNSIKGDTASILLGITNCTSQPVEFELSVDIGADFFDSFEARGVKRQKRGTLAEPIAKGDTLELGYVGLDNIKRTTTIKCEPAFASYKNDRLQFPISIEGNTFTTVTFKVECAEHAEGGSQRCMAPRARGRSSRTGSTRARRSKSATVWCRPFWNGA